MIEGVRDGKAVSSLEQRFWSKVKKAGPDECWQWQGACRRGGYGYIRAGSQAGGGLAAHRVSWVLAYGEIPEGMLVCHTCDKPACVNPAHLFLGTYSDNIQDAYDRGRRQASHRSRNVGEKHPGAKLTEEWVREILARHASGKYTHAELAAVYGVARQTITNIMNRRRWKHI